MKYELPAKVNARRVWFSIWLVLFVVLLSVSAETRSSWEMVATAAFVSAIFPWALFLLAWPVLLVLNLVWLLLDGLITWYLNWITDDGW